jgi:hypothetical protein
MELFKHLSRVEGCPNIQFISFNDLKDIIYPIYSLREDFEESYNLKITASKASNSNIEVFVIKFNDGVTLSFNIGDFLYLDTNAAKHNRGNFPALSLINIEDLCVKINETINVNMKDYKVEDLKKQWGFDRKSLLNEKLRSDKPHQPEFPETEGIKFKNELHLYADEGRKYIQYDELRRKFDCCELEPLALFQDDVLVTTFRLDLRNNLIYNNDFTVQIYPNQVLSLSTLEILSYTLYASITGFTPEPSKYGKGNFHDLVNTKVHGQIPKQDSYELLKQYKLATPEFVEKKENSDTAAKPVLRNPTRGEYVVGVNFNPSNNPLVDKVKTLTAELIDLMDCEEIKNLNMGNHEIGRLKDIAVERYEEAAMWAVKAITKSK